MWRQRTIVEALYDTSALLDDNATFFLAAILFREGKDENELNFIGCVCVNLNTVWLKFLLLKYRGIYDGNFSY